MSDSDWLFPDPNAEVRQGDFLLRRNPSSGAVLESCIVITADCDIRNRKFGNRLACLQIDLLHDYVRFDWARGKFNKAIANDSEQLRSQIAKWHTAKLGRTSSLTAKGCEDWIRRESADSICTALDVPTGDRRKLVAAIDTYGEALNASEAHTGGDFLTRLVAFKAKSARKAIDLCLKETLAQAQNESLPEDVFLLPLLPYTDNGAALVKLRELTAVDYSLIKYRASEADSSEHFLRTGRLQPTLKYAISQKFGALYSKIGLPSEFEERHKKAIESVSEILLEHK